MEDVLALLVIFAGGVLVVLPFSPVGRAIADRIRGQKEVQGQDPAVYEELERMRQEISELQERVDFNERLLAQTREAGQLGASGGH